jgi:D-alanyl-D-alanine carboxypeptidase
MAPAAIISKPESTLKPLEALDPAPVVTQTFNKKLHSIDEDTSLWRVVNKTRKLAVGYKPANLVVPNTTLRLNRGAEQMQVRADVAPQLEALITAAKAAGHSLSLSSAYRSEALQKQFYDSYVAKDGQAQADIYSARPSYSEHQTGLAADLGRTDQNCQLQICFGDTEAGKWLAANAHTYGFIIRYMQGKEQITGYQYEPWHIRYVGTDLATEIHKTGQTLEEFFGLPAAPDYQ